MAIPSELPADPTEVEIASDEVGCRIQIAVINIQQSWLLIALSRL